ncbi:hypothetical protein CUZ56_01497 [Saezia sanguinis]|jgi:prophage regulatory protein|uniref:Prophage CP4-57 regulatory protein (AlpA) n=1 Tax=Saezia sanguinis TaxID=1965230 RepID=A0A433SD85_9BURK|nr:AlpA family phage regulatory protein [Saezia sanguinis]RUS66707.1 hypothetical protein CUZ56_01497 [Saezia sanguinis]
MSNTKDFPVERRFLRISEVMRRVGYKRTQLYKMIREGRFPPNFQIGARAVAWDSKDIDQWMQEQKSQSCK